MKLYELLATRNTDMVTVRTIRIGRRKVGRERSWNPEHTCRFCTKYFYMLNIRYKTLRLHC